MVVFEINKLAFSEKLPGQNPKVRAALEPGALNRAEASELRSVDFQPDSAVALATGDDL